MKDMEKNISKAVFILTILALFPLTSFAQFNLDEMTSRDINQVALPDIGMDIPVPEPVAKPVDMETDDKSEIKTVKEWTIMTYVNSKNDLEHYGLSDINEMEKVGSTDEINIVAEIGRMAGHSSADGDWRGTRRLYIRKDSDIFRITSPIIQNLGKVNMGDWKELVKFVEWAKAEYPAKHYMLIVWNHGNGWFEDNPVKNADRGISYDEETGNNIDTPQLGKVLAKVGKIDIYASDACLMQMASVAYEIGDSVDYIIGSEEIEPGRGYTYNKFLAPLKNNPNMSSFELSKKVVSENVNFFSGNTQSVINTRQTKYLPLFTNKFVDAVMKANLKREVKAARDAAETYAIADNKDMYDFVRLVVISTSNQAVKTTGKELMNFLKNDLIAYNETGIMSTKSHGLAVYLPTIYYSSTYEKLKWTNDSAWDEFIKWYRE
ncbi:MAG: clostripain-related cysteine peptidase [Elusimicrobia bacterium]|nr:clostripain-related cysteine peptidase [Elusimicrobiota bacterium]